MLILYHCNGCPLFKRQHLRHQSILHRTAPRYVSNRRDDEFSNATMLSLHGRRLSTLWKTWACRCSYPDSPIHPPLPPEVMLVPWHGGLKWVLLNILL